MSFEAIQLSIEERVATVTLNRPERMNAWNAQMAGEMTEVLHQLNGDDGVRVVVITGAGRAFCAGADLGGGGGTFAGRENRPQPQLEPILPWQLDKPVIAAINGAAVGVGLTYPMMCDLRIVAEDAKLQFAFVRRGVIPELASHVIVARVAGLSNAADLLLSGRMILGREAAAMGLASEALPREQVLPRALERAREIAVSTAPVSVAIAKHLLWEGLASSVPQMREREGRLFTWAGNQPDAKEGVLSFLEKRVPEWKLSVAKDTPRDLLSGSPGP